jgi:exonuclease III
VQRALKGWRIYWAHNNLRQPPSSSRQGTTSQRRSGGNSSGSQRRSTVTQQPTAPRNKQHRSSAGVAIAIRETLLQEQGGPAAVTDVQPNSDGRLISLRLDWGGHKLRLASIYMPNQPTAQREFLQASLGQLASLTGRRSVAVWGGDFNFVEDQQLDRVTHRRSHETEQRIAAEWQKRLSELKAPLVDAFRCLHPTRRSYSHFSPAGAARLDRFYMQGELLPFVASAAVGERRPSTSASACSDHRPVTIEIIPRSPTVLPHNPVRRLRLHFAADASLAKLFEEEAAEAASTAPAGAAEFVAWWPGFKRRIAALCRQLNRQWRTAQQQGSAAAWEEQEELYRRYQEGDNAALPALLAQRQQLAASVAAELADRGMQQRRQWLHGGERPSPALTQQLQPPAEARGIPALRSPAGTLHSTPQACSELVANYWAGISAQPRVSSSAQQAVLSAVEGMPQLGARQAAQLGSRKVTAAEVRRALRHSKPGTAPGQGGIPVQLYRKFKATLQPLLTQLFSSIGASGQLPRGFHDGIISVLHKKGSRADPANYRPITLLNTDYRLLAKVLAHRLGAVLPSIIGTEQTAFVRGRSIGENCHLLQLLPHLLAKERRWGLVVFCDFRKAYDTVDRGFLLAVLRALGLGADFISWAQLLLTNTRAAALVNGHLSKPARSAAGVRQGCPLAPLLYLCLGQAALPPSPT